jgi:hypothetical protein
MAEKVGMVQILWPLMDERETAGYGKRIKHKASAP